MEGPQGSTPSVLLRLSHVAWIVYDPLVAPAQGTHLFPFRPEPLSPAAPIVLPERVGEYVAAKSLHAPSADGDGAFFVSAISAWARRSRGLCAGSRGRVYCVCALEAGSYGRYLRRSLLPTTGARRDRGLPPLSQTHEAPEAGRDGRPR